MCLKIEISHVWTMKHLGSKSGNSNSYVKKRWHHGFSGFGEKSENIMGGSEKYKLTGTNSGEERFDSVFWKN